MCEREKKYIKRESVGENEKKKAKPNRALFQTYKCGTDIPESVEWTVSSHREERDSVRERQRKKRRRDRSAVI